ncbi:MAG: hypothetical protein AB1656_18620 [Candidatus Omnitrophota bacterium]
MAICYFEGTMDEQQFTSIFGMEMKQVDLLAPFLYQFIGGGLVLLAGLWGALRVGALDFSDKKDRLWMAAILGAVLIYMAVQGAFQFVFGAA